MENFNTNDYYDDKPLQPMAAGTSRRQFLTQIGLGGIGLAAVPYISRGGENVPVLEAPEMQQVRFTVNGKPQQLILDTRVTQLSGGSG